MPEFMGNSRGDGRRIAIVASRFNESITLPLAEGAVDSLGLEQLAEYVDEVYGVVIEDEEIVDENFESLTALAALVVSKC